MVCCELLEFAPPSRLPLAGEPWKEGWLKQTGPLRQVKLRGLEKVDWLFVFSCAAHNLLRLPRLIAQQPPARLGEQCA